MDNIQRSFPPIVFSTCRKYQDVALVTLKNLLNLLNRESFELEIFIFSDSDEILNYLKIQTNHKIKIYTFNSNSWNKVMLNGVNNLMSEKYKYCLLMLDDFYFKSFDFLKLSDLYKTIIENDLDYLKLKVDSFNRIFSSHLKSPRFKHSLNNCYLINPDHPYPCSLQVSFWNLNYLSEKLRNPGNIWDFENQAASPFSYVVGSNAINTFDLLEKGKKRLGSFFIKDAKDLDRLYPSAKDLLIDIRRRIRKLILSSVGLQKKSKKIYILNSDLEKSIMFNPFFSKNDSYAFLFLRYKYNIYHVMDLSTFTKSPILFLRRLISIPFLSFYNGISIRRFVFKFDQSKFNKFIKNQTIIIFYRKTKTQSDFIRNIESCNIILIIDYFLINHEDEKYIQNILINNKNKNIQILSPFNIISNEITINNEFYKKKYLNDKWFEKNMKFNFSEKNNSKMRF